MLGHCWLVHDGYQVPTYSAALGSCGVTPSSTPVWSVLCVSRLRELDVSSSSYPERRPHSDVLTKTRNAK